MRIRLITKPLLISVMISILCLTGFSKDETVSSFWAAFPVAIDGVETDWPIEALVSVKKLEVDYAFMNDSQHLYVLFIFNNPQLLSTIKSTGMTIWFNTEGKNKKLYGIRFKEKQISADELIATLEKQQGTLPEEIKNQYKSKPFYIGYIGDVIDKKGNALTLPEVSGGLDVPVFREKRQKQLSYYEFRIPLNTLEKISESQKIEPGNVVKVGFEWGGMTQEILKQKASQLGTSSTTAREGAAEMVLNEERTERMGDDSTSLSSLRRGTQKYSFWVDVKLAQKQ